MADEDMPQAQQAAPESPAEQHGKAASQEPAADKAEAAGKEADGSAAATGDGREKQAAGERKDRRDSGAADKAGLDKRRRSESPRKRRSNDDDFRSERRRSRSRDRDRKDKERDRNRERGDRKERRRSRSRSRDRRRTSRSRSRDRRRSSRHRSRSRSRDRHAKRSRSRDKYRSSREKDGRRRRDESDEEYGGYKPRKRVEDKAAAGVNNAMYDPFFHLRQQNKITNPQDALRMWQEQQLQARLLVLQEQAASAAAAASKTQRELYIGNLMAGQVTEDALRQVFNSALVAAFPECSTPGAEPVVNINMHTDGRYAFIEFRKPEYATAALALNGQVQLMGQAISVGRPAAYVDPTKAQMAAEAAAKALADFRAGNTSVLAGQGIPEGPGQVPATAQPTKTTYLAITGVVSVDAMTDDQEYQETVEDLRDESSKAGAVVDLFIPRPANKETAKAAFGTNNYGKAFIQFDTVESAEKAKGTMHGRMFAGQMVTVTFVTAEVFAQAKAAAA